MIKVSDMVMNLKKIEKIYLCNRCHLNSNVNNMHGGLLHNSSQNRDVVIHTVSIVINPTILSFRENKIHHVCIQWNLNYKIKQILLDFGIVRTEIHFYLFKSNV